MKPKKVDTVSSQLNPEELQLIDFFAGLRRNSIESIEAAARQLIGLVTTLLGLFFGVLAFKDQPTYLANTEIKVVGLLAAVGYIFTLFAALNVVMPRKLEIPQYDLTAMRELLESLFDHKSTFLRTAQLNFAFATLALLVLILMLLYR